MVEPTLPTGLQAGIRVWYLFIYVFVIKQNAAGEGGREKRNSILKIPNLEQYIPMPISYENHVNLLTHLSAYWYLH